MDAGVVTILICAALVCLAGIGGLTRGHWRCRARLRITDERALQALSSGSLLAQRIDLLEREKANYDALIDRLDRMSSELRERISAAEGYMGVLVPPRETPGGLNISKRAEICRRLKDGIALAKISEDLEVPLSEVRLIAHLEIRPKPAARRSRRQRPSAA